LLRIQIPEQFSNNGCVFIAGAVDWPVVFDRVGIAACDPPGKINMSKAAIAKSRSFSIAFLL